MTVASMSAVFGWLVSAGLMVWAGPSAAGQVDLVLRPAIQTVDPGDVVTLQLVAVVPAGGAVSLAAVDALLTWDETKLEFLGIENTGPYSWLIAGMLPDPGALNDDLTDGDAVFTALARFDADAFANGEGLLLASIRFRAVIRTVTTPVAMNAGDGSKSRTTVFGRESPVQDITGHLGQSGVRIGTPGDCTGDRAAGNADFGGLQSCFTGPVGPVDPPGYSVGVSSCCPAFDFNADGDVDLNDLAAFVATAP